MNRVLNHLPSVYGNIKEFQELSQSQANELDLLDVAILQVENDQFILTSSEPAIYRREKELKIIPDKTVESLDFRKKRVLSRMQSNPPYTKRYLKVLLDDLLGENKHVINIDALLFDLEVLVNVESASFYKEVVKMLERIVPLNMSFQTAVILLTEYLVLRCESYSFGVEYKRTNKFSTAPIKGIGRLVEKLIMFEKAYDFPTNYLITNTFKTASSPGLVAEDVTYQLSSEGYTFPTNFPITGKLIARSDGL